MSVLRMARWGVAVALLTTVAARAGDLPTPFKTATIGQTAKGDAGAEGDQITVNNTGTDIWEAADAFQFVYQPLNGDGEIVAQVTSLGESNEWAKAGVMIRDGLDPDAAHAMCVVTPQHGVVMQRRDAKGLESESSDIDAKPGTAPIWVKLVRKGFLITAYCSKDGQAWDKVDERDMKISSDALVGLAVTSHDEAVPTKAVFDHVTVKAGG